MKLIKMPSISQFRNIVQNVIRQAQYVETLEDGTVIYDKNAKLPILKFTGTEKIHGTNAAFCMNNHENWCQSKNNIITPEKDNAGFAFFVEARKDSFINIVKNLSETHNINLDKKTICLFGEFCGGNIQKLSCFSNTDKKFVLFQYFKVQDIETKESQWLET